MRRVRTAGIVGLNWGLIHLRGLREAGCEVVTLAATQADRAREVAEREGVPQWTTDVDSLNALDVVVVATPATSHAAVLQVLTDPFVICEKPLLGLTGTRAELPAIAGRMFVNYAFPFLSTARAAADVVSRRGHPSHVDLAVTVNLPLDFGPAAWFLEAASHPLSWLLHTFGEPDPVDRRETAESYEVALTCARVAIRAASTLGGEPGIHQSIDMRWADGDLSIRGRYRPGEVWNYDPVLVDGAPINDGERTDSDCWMDANAASVGAMLQVFRSETPLSEGLAGGLFDAEKALWLERSLRDDI